MQNRQGDLKKFVANATAPIEHLFNTHIDSSWCWSREIEDKVEEIISIRNEKNCKIKFLLSFKNTQFISPVPILQ